MHTQCFMVKKMVYCSHCGTQIAEDTYFCPRCGTKTEAGKTAKAAYPLDELHDIFDHVGAELEKAFTFAAHETQEAFKRAGEEIRKNSSKPTVQEGTVVCPNCGFKNVSDASFCYKCGKNSAVQTSSGKP